MTYKLGNIIKINKNQIKYTFIKENDNLFSYVITRTHKREILKLTIYITQEQLDKFNILEYYLLNFRVKTRIKTNSKWIYPTIQLTIGGTPIPLAKFLYPGIDRPWNETMWKNRPWDFSKENLKISEISGISGISEISENKFHCNTCDSWLNIQDQIRYNCCLKCSYKKDLIRWAKHRIIAKNKNLKDHQNLEFEIDINQFKNINNCAISNLPLEFEEKNSLYGATLDRIDSKIGYTIKNTRVVCRALNALKRDYDDNYLFDFFKNSYKGKIQDIIINPRLSYKLAQIINRTHRTLNDSLDIFYLFDLLKQTNGVCSITGVNLDLNFSKAYSLYIPSIDKIIPSKGYIRGNVQFISYGANLMKGAYSTTEETRDFYKKVLTNLKLN